MKRAVQFSLPASKPEDLSQLPSLTGYVPHLPLPPPLKESLKFEVVAAPELSDFRYDDQGNFGAFREVRPRLSEFKPEAVAAPGDPKLKKAADSGTESESEDEEVKAKAKRLKHYLKAAKKDSLAEAKERMRKFARLAAKDKHRDEAVEIANEYLDASPHDMETLGEFFENELNKELNKRPAPTVDPGEFEWFTHHGTDYKMNKRGDVVTPDMEWVGRWNGFSINEKVRRPDDLKGKVYEL